jgi:hypothetical protein
MAMSKSYSNTNTRAVALSGAQNFLDLVSNTNTHAARTRTGTHGPFDRRLVIVGGRADFS